MRWSGGAWPYSKRGLSCLSAVDRRFLLVLNGISSMYQNANRISIRPIVLTPCYPFQRVWKITNDGFKPKIHIQQQRLTQISYYRSTSTDTVLDDPNSMITYTGSWTTNQDPNFYGGSSIYTSTTGDSMSFSFVGESGVWFDHLSYPLRLLSGPAFALSTHTDKCLFNLGDSCKPSCRVT